MPTRKDLSSGMLTEQNKLPPQAIDLEEVVLGACLLEKKAIDQVHSFLKPQHFYLDKHKKIYEAVITMYDRGDPVDILTITHELRKMNKLDEIGGPFYLSSLITRVASTQNIEYHARIMIEKYMAREIIILCSQKIKEAFDQNRDVFEMLDEFSKQIQEINPIRNESMISTSKDIVQNFYDMLTSPKPGSIIIGRRTGHIKFDKLFSIGPNQIFTLAAAQGEGKSRFASNIMFRLLDEYSDVSIFWNSFEDSARDILSYYISWHTQYDPKDIKMRIDKMSPEQKEEVWKYAERFAKYDIKFTDVSDRILNIEKRFRNFCELRQGRFNIMVLDNLMSLQDAMDFSRNKADFYDFVCSAILNMKQRTQALIFIIHHFNKQDEEFKDKYLLRTGYRANEKHMKGTEALARISNKILLINNPDNKKDLIDEYSENKREILENLFIIEAGKLRDASRQGNEGIIHMWKNLGCLQFEEVETEIHQQAKHRMI